MKKKSRMKRVSVIFLTACLLALSLGCSKGENKDVAISSEPETSETVQEPVTAEMESMEPVSEVPSIEEISEVATEEASEEPQSEVSSEAPEPDSEPEQPSEPPVAPPPAVSTGVTTDAPGMAAYGLTSFVAAGMYPYTTICKNDASQYTTGTVTFSQYTRTDAGGDYDYITVNFTLTYSDENANQYGAKPLLSAADYYLYEDGGKNADLDDGNHGKYTIVWNGVTYDNCNVTYVDLGSGWDGGVGTVSTQYVFKVPSGYDGCVVWVATHPGVSGYGKHLSQLNGLIMYRCN